MLQVHLDHAKNQRRIVIEVLKNVATKVLIDKPLASLERCDSIDRWTCDHETTTKSDQLLMQSRQNYHQNGMFSYTIYVLICHICAHMAYMFSYAIYVFI